MKKFNIYVYTPKQTAAYNEDNKDNGCSCHGNNLLAFIFDADEDFLPDETPDWLYALIDKAGGDWSEHEESKFEIERGTLSALLCDPHCNYARYCTLDEAFCEDMGIEGDEDAGVPIAIAGDRQCECGCECQCDEDEEDEDEDNEADEDANGPLTYRKAVDVCSKMLKEQGFTDEKLRELFPHWYK